MNPFQVWAELTRGLRDRFVEELGERVKSPYAGEAIGSLAGLITHIRHIGAAVERLRQKDPEVYAAFLRAMERTGEL